MIELSTKIAISSGNGDFQTATSNIADNNGRTDLSNLIGDNKGYSFVGSELSNASGEFKNPYVIDITAKQAVESVYLHFDLERKAYPKTIYALVGRQPRTLTLAAMQQTNKYYVGSQVYSNLEFVSDIKITRLEASGRLISTTAITDLITRFDEATKAITIYLKLPSTYDGAILDITFSLVNYDIENVVSNSSHIAKIDFLPYPSAILGFKDWSLPNSPLVISRIDNGIYLYLGKREQISSQFETKDRDNNKLPSFGVMSTTDRIEFNDISDEVLTYAELGLLKDGLKATTYLNNTLTGKFQIVNEKYTKEWQYDSYNKICKVTLSDNLVSWQDINVEAINYDPRYPKSQNAKWYYDYLYDKTPSKDLMPTFDDLDTQTKAILENTHIEYPYLESGNLWSQWNKLCYLCQLHIFKNIDGKCVCKYNGGN